MFLPQDAGRQAGLVVAIEDITEKRRTDGALAPWMILLVSGLRFWSQRWRLPRARRWFMVGFGLLDLVALWVNL